MSDSVSDRFYRILAGRPVQELIANLNARIDGFEYAGRTLPCTLTDRVGPNCFVASPHAGIIDYALDETVKLPPHRQKYTRLLLKLFSLLLRAVKIDKTAGINNYCLSTNPLPHNLLPEGAADFTGRLKARYPDRALLLRSLNRPHHAALLDALQQAGWDWVVSRQVYLFHNPQEYGRRINSRRDAKLLNDPDYRFRRLAADSPAEDFDTAVSFYNQLYLNKYSKQNVQFTAAMLHEMTAAGVMELYLLEHLGTPCAAVGMVGEDNVLTAPAVGYDMSRPQSDALYRRVMAFVMQQAAARGLLLNFSSGAPDFKRVRGGMPALEYTAVYTAHLPFYRRAVWRLAGRLSRVYYADILITHRL